MRGGLALVIGLDLDDDAAASLALGAEQEGRADQFGRNRMDAAVEEAFSQAAGFRTLTSSVPLPV